MLSPFEFERQQILKADGVQKSWGYSPRTRRGCTVHGPDCGTRWPSQASAAEPIAAQRGQRGTGLVLSSSLRLLLEPIRLAAQVANAG